MAEGSRCAPPIGSGITSSMTPSSNRSFAAPLANDHRQNRDRQPRHHQQIVRDRFGLPAFFGSDPWISPRRVNEGEDLTSKFFGQLHQAERLSVALRVWHPEISLHAVLECLSFLVPDDHHRPPV